MSKQNNPVLRNDDTIKDSNKQAYKKWWLHKQDGKM